MPETQIALPDVDIAKELGLLPEEFEKIKLILGRNPNFNELSIFAVMWSEHCSYKNSITYLKKLPRKGKHLLVEAGEENAGLVDIGDGLACAFKIESHNHPSAVEPYQGAATGVGGIHRDIFTMGARPIAALNSLRFGDLENAKTKRLLKGVVRGIGDYGNCFGVPTVGGEVYFDPCYNGNPLVNAMSAGIVEIGKTISATSEGVGNPIYIVGASTGKDGIHGATFASEDLGDNAEENIPAVQIGDPFQEKLLLEASLEAIATNALVGMQDMGAAGITCSTSEMSAKGEHGMRIDLDKVPTRQPNMKPWEILLSESQERMLLVVKKGQEAVIEAVFEKWEVQCELIGEVTAGKDLEYYMNGELVAKLPAFDLVLGGGAPIYQRSFKKPAYHEQRDAFDQTTITDLKSVTSVAKKVIGLPNIVSKKWIYQQYDSMVGIANTATNKPADATVVRIMGHRKGLVLTVDCNSRYVHADAQKGAAIAVSEAARNIVCSGGVPVAITNCLNFGNPYDEEVYWNFVHALKGMGEACEKFETPVTGGNVSFYNQSGDKAINPTPTIGMLGIIDDVQKRMTLSFQEAGDRIIMIGPDCLNLNSSEYLVHEKGVGLSPAPDFDLEVEHGVQKSVIDLIQSGLIKSAHDISEGGLITCLLESCFEKDLGFRIDAENIERKDAFYFGESQSRIVVSVGESNVKSVIDLLSKNQLPYRELGSVTEGEIQVSDEALDSIDSYKSIYFNTLEDALVQ